MPDRWLQIKGDPSVRAFLFQQQRVDSMFDDYLDRVLAVMHTMLTVKGAFHVKAHFSSSQLTCWFYDDPYNYRVYVKEDAIDPAMIHALPDFTYEDHSPIVTVAEISPILSEFKRLRLTDAQVYLRNASLNRINGMIGMTFSCDGSHYISCRDFFQRLDCFGKDV
jgi:hypothetical protein